MRDSNGRFASSKGRSNGSAFTASEPKRVDDQRPLSAHLDPEQRMIEEAWEEQQLPAAFARLRPQTDNLFALATPAQLQTHRASRRRKCYWQGHGLRVVGKKAMQEGKNG
jgi:hypothetical protein